MHSYRDLCAAYYHQKLRSCVKINLEFNMCSLYLNLSVPYHSVYLLPFIVLWEQSMQREV